MATDTWTDGLANWTTAADWSTGTVPGAGDTVVVPGPTAGGPDPQVTSNVGTVAAVTNNGEIDFNNGGMLAVSGNVANNGNLALDQTSSGKGGSFLTIGGTLTNTSGLTIGNQSLTSTDTVSVGALVNSGTYSDVIVSGGIFNGGTAKASLIVNSAAGFGTQGVLTGTVNLYGNALLQFASGVITANQGRLTLSGADSFIADAGATTSDSALALTSNSGTLQLESGASLSTPGALPNGGSIDVGDGGTTTSTLTINSAPGFGTAGVVNGAVRLGPYGTIAFTQGGQLTSIAVNSSLVIDNPTAFSAAGSTSGLFAFANLSGPIALAGASYTNNAAVMNLDATGAISLTQGGALTQAGSITNGGSIDVEGASLTVNGTLTSSNTTTIGTQRPTFNQPNPPAAGTSILNVNSIAVTGGQFFLGSSAAVTTSNVLLSNNALLDLGGPANSLSSAITFASGASATLEIDAAEVPTTGGAFSNTVSGFGGGNTIDLRSLAYTSTTTATLTGSTLTVSNGNSTDTLTLSNPGGTLFATSSDGNGGTDVTVTCFDTGTRVRTTQGDVAVEELRIGDVVLTPTGAHRPIRWLGHRTLVPSRHPHPYECMPIAIAAHAFGDNRPSRDLRVSPGHAICVDLLGEVLIPAGSLVNGATIVQEDVASVTYWHVELEGGHDIVLAENLPCESFLDMGNRSFFAEADATALHASPDSRTVSRADFCRPFYQDGPVVTFVRERLAARSPDLGWTLEQVPFADLHLLIDGQRVDAETSELSARFLVPADAKDVWLISDTSVPAEIGMAPDLRALGVCVGSLVITDGFGTTRKVLADDPRLSVGFHNIEQGPQRWTAGRSRLPAVLWESCPGSFFLLVELTRPALPRWIAPDSCSSTRVRGSLRLRGDASARAA